MQAPDELMDGRWASEILASLPARLHMAVDEWVERAPDSVALVDDSVRWTYADLGAGVTAGQEWLSALGLRPGDRLMAVSENGRALAALLLAASAMDVWVAIVNARLSAKEIDSIADNCRPRRVIYTVEVSPSAKAHGERHGAELKTVPPLGEIAAGPLATDVQPEPVDSDGSKQVAAMIYTSGTTGNPKGVMLTHRGILYVGLVSGAMRRLKPGQRVYGVLPMSHVFGLSSVCLGTLSNGATLYTKPRFDPAALVQALHEERISALQGVPAMFSRTLEYLATHDITPDTESLVYMSAGGAPLDLDLKGRTESVFGTTLHNGYGLTEASPTISQTRIGEHHDNTTVGKFLPLLEYRFLHDGAQVPPGEVGELGARGPNIMRGYYRNPTATAEALDSDGWLHTGDLGRVDEDGNLFIVGRSKELIIRSGFNVYPTDVEAVLNEHPEVTLSAVVGREVADNEEVIAFVQCTPGSQLTAEALSDFAAERLSPYKRPQRIVFVDELPATNSGKIIKARLKKAAEELE